MTRMAKLSYRPYNDLVKIDEEKKEWIPLGEKCWLSNSQIGKNQRLNLALTLSCACLLKD